MDACATPTGIELLPPLYQRWVEELLAGPIPAETGATCGDCAMCSPSAPHGDATHFSPRVKCCSYQPDLANYLVGRALSDESPGAARGRESVRARIRGRFAVTPLGVGRTRMYEMLNREGGFDSFGRSEALLCPHYVAERGVAERGVAESGSCGIWAHRNSTCATWFCKHVRGATGMRFWREAMRPLLASVEVALSRWCALELGLGGDALARLVATPRREARAGREIDGEIDEAEYAALWGKWATREEDLYLACAARVERLAWREVVVIAGAEIAMRAEVARSAYARLMSRGVPPLVHLNELTMQPSGPDSVRIATYSTYDPIELPRPLANVLHRFDGRPTADVLRDLAAEGIELDPEIVSHLADFHILVE